MLSDKYLDGFNFVPTDNRPYLTLDKSARIYINTSIARIMDIETYDKVAVAYRPASEEIAIVKATGIIEARASVFVVDKRNYLHVKKLVKEYDLFVDKPIRYVYEAGSSEGNVFIFKRTKQPKLIKSARTREK